MRQLLCAECVAHIKFSGGTTNLTYHMNKHHPGRIGHYKKTDNRSSMSTNDNSDLSKAKVSPPTQRILPGLLGTKYPSHSSCALLTTDKVCKFIMKDLRPYRIVDSPEFRDLLHTLHPRYNVPVEVCESEDANLLFPNTPSSSAGDIRAKTWNKENGIRLASWMAITNFITNPSYGDRLMAIGENSVKIRNAARNDTGFYTLVLTSGSTPNFIEFTVYLEVLVPPTNHCIPNITHGGDTLMAILPLEGCGIPRLIPNWTSGTQKLISDHISVLDLKSGPKPEVYIACAVGKSKRCIQVDCSNLCKTSAEPQTQNESDTGLILWWIPVLIGIIIIIIVTAAVLLYWIKKKKYLALTDTMKTVEEAVEEIPLMDPHKTEEIEDGRTDPHEEFLEQGTTPVIGNIKGVGDIRRYLIDEYKTMKGVALSACYEENLVDVSEVYCELIIQDKEGTENVTSRIFSSADTENARPIPAMIIGECGSGKTTWCKNLVHQWCQYNNKESNLDLKDSSIPDIARFEILLYIQLKKRLKDASFLEHIRHTLFANNTDYFERTRSCISEHSGSVLLLIDGLDEVTCNLEPIVNLLKEKEMVPCSIVLTSRHNGLECLQEKDGISLRFFKIQGMSLERSKEYASKVLDIFCRIRGEKLDVNHFWKFANHIQVPSMCNIPLLCLSLILFWIESKAISADLTDVLLTIVEYYLRRAMTRELYKKNIRKVLEQQHVDISVFIAKTKDKQYLRDHGYLLKVISDEAKNLWCSQMDVDTDEKSIKKETNTVDNGNDVKFCLETGILIKTFNDKFERTRSQITFSHTLLFDLFVALSITMEKGESFRRCITTKKAVVKNSCMIHMLCQVALNIGQEIIRDISKIFDKDNEKREVSDQQLICDIECNNPKQGGVPVKWLKTLMCMDELSNAKLLILTEGLKITKELTHFDLELPENKNELIFRLPILPKVQALKVDIENCTLLLHEEQEWNKGISSQLRTLVIKSVNIDVKTTGYIIEAISTCKDLLKLEFCPKDNSNAQILALGSKKAFYCWGRLAEGIEDMTKLHTVRLHNLQIGEHLPALLKSLCRCPKMDILDLMNVKEETGTVKIQNGSDQELYGCEHHEAKQLKYSKGFMKIFGTKPYKTLHLIKNAMSENSWLILCEQMESLSPHIVQIEQVPQSGRVVNDLLQGIGKFKDLKILTICSIDAGNVPVVFSDLRHLHKLEKLTLCKIKMEDWLWKKLSEILARLTKLKELSLAHLDIRDCFIKVEKLSKVKLLVMKEVNLEEALWLKLGDEVMTSNLQMLELVSCKMSKNGHLFFLDKMNRSALDVKMEKNSKVEDSEMLSVDMVATSVVRKDEFESNTE